jgi:hypothetical protein
MRSTGYLAPLLVFLACGAAACGSVADDDVQLDAGAPDFDAAVVGCTAPDTDGDGVCDTDDICAGSDDGVDTDSDGVPDGCDACAGSDDANDIDSDTVPDGCDLCPANDDLLDADNDSVADGCDGCPGFDDGADADNDGVADGCDLCPGFDDSIDINNNNIPDACEGNCDTATEVDFNGRCYYLDGSGGACDAGYVLASQSVLSNISTQFAGKTYKNVVSDNCCITHADQAAENQDWGMDSAECNQPGAFTMGPVLGGSGCADANNNNPAQLTFCRTQ